MSETTRVIVKNRSCLFCTNEAYVNTYGPFVKAGRIVRPMIVPSFDPDESLPPNWRVRLIMHGRYEQTSIFVFQLTLGAVLQMNGRPVFPLNSLDADSNWFKRTGELCVLGTVPDRATAKKRVLPGIRTRELLVFGDRAGLVCSTVTIPVMHIVASYEEPFTQE